MRIKVSELRALIRAELHELNESFVEQPEEKPHPFIDSPKGLRVVNVLTHAASQIDEVLETKFEVIVSHLKNDRFDEAMSVASGVEEHTKTIEQLALKKVEQIRHWRAAVDDFFDEYKKVSGDEILKNRVSRLVAPHLKQAQQKKSSEPIDWSKEIEG
jgi:hypothetical protein